MITHGMPRTASAGRPSAADDAWDPAGPTNLELARLLERTLRAIGAVPATVAVRRGTLHIGLDDEQLVELAGETRPAKAAARDLAWCMATDATAGLTVAGTLEACTSPTLGTAGITCFATGGIGGAHRGWAASGDISADLLQLARRRVCVVSAGPKAILDVAATAEFLDSLGVPIVGFRTDCMPRFVCPADPAIPLSAHTDDPVLIARSCDLRWRALEQPGGVLVVQPVRPHLAVHAEEFEAALGSAEEAARARCIRGPAVTPFLLESMRDVTAGRSLEANVALLVDNATLAGRIAAGFSTLAATG